MSEINSIANGTYTIGQTSATKFVAGPGIVIDEPSAGTVRIGNDETVLWENTTSALTKDITWPQTLSETVNNFEKVKFYYGADSTIIKTHAYEFYTVDKTSYSLVDFRVNDSNNNVMFRNGWFNLDGSSLNNTFNLTINLNSAFSTTNANNQGWNYLYKIVGINRKEV